MTNSPENLFNNNRNRLVIGLAAAALLLGAISLSSSGTENKAASTGTYTQCAKPSMEGWAPYEFSDFATVDRLADYLHVTNEDVMNGMAGPAWCDKDIQAENLDTGTTTASVEGVSDKCIVINDEESSVDPQPTNKEYHSLKVFCAVKDVNN